MSKNILSSGSGFLNLSAPSKSTSFNAVTFGGFATLPGTGKPVMALPVAQQPSSIYGRATNEQLMQQTRPLVDRPSPMLSQPNTGKKSNLIMYGVIGLVLFLLLKRKR